jgi:hypothetical protein
LSDSDTIRRIRVRARAWRARPCRSGEAEGSLRDGLGSALRRDGSREEVAAGGGPVWQLRRGPSLLESVLERSPARELGCGMPSGERTLTRKKTIGVYTGDS